MKFIKYYFFFLTIKKAKKNGSRFFSDVTYNLRVGDKLAIYKQPSPENFHKADLRDLE